MNFLVWRGDLSRYRNIEEPAPEPADGQVRLRVQAFSLTSNNITYAMLGSDRHYRYWEFFPASDGWGSIPMWGFVEVDASNHGDVRVGEQFYGLVPPAQYLLVHPTGLSELGFVDGTDHRTSLPSTYNTYLAASRDPMHHDGRESQEMLLRPLFTTAFLLDDALREWRYDGADALVLSSASSKTAQATAFMITQRPRGERPELIGLTSAAHLEALDELGLYDRVLAYDQTGSMSSRQPTLYVDFAGNARLRRELHEHFGSELRRDLIVGAAHRDQVATKRETDLPGPAPSYFFAPAEAERRAAEWGELSYAHAVADAWTNYVAWADGWLTIREGNGPAAVRAAYLDVLETGGDPRQGYVLSPS